MKMIQKIEETGNRRETMPMIAMAFFQFVFLGTEYLFDNSMALVTGPAQVVIGQGYILGASVLGFVLYPAAVYGAEKKGQKMSDPHTMPSLTGGLSIFVGAMAGIICIFVIWQHPSRGILLAVGCLCFILLGMGGSAVHYSLSLAAAEHSFSKAVGASYAAGICLQVWNHQMVKDAMTESVVLAVSTAVFAVLLLKAEAEQKYEKQQKPERKINSPVSAVLWMSVLVILLTCIFSTLDAAVTLGHAAGSADVGAWPRLLLAGSGLLAGVLFDGWQHRFCNIIMYCVTVLSVLCIVILGNGGAFLVSLAVFYLAAGFFVVFFTTGFMRISAATRWPRLWAGLGRAINNLCAFLMGPVSVRLLLMKNQALCFGALLGVLALISLAFFGYVHAMQPEERPDEKMGEGYRQAPNEEEQLQIFAKQFSLTARETEVLQILLVSEENIQDIAEKLLISRAALYRHIASLNEKTGTKSRIGLVQFYYRYQGRITDEKETDQ